MLKALELYGFKSFADKTRFDFPAGITVVVGPNGSGKSNIVDAIKWVLGEQSAKSLRGKEMADVIFKGSGEGGNRRVMNAAEATIIFDNSDQRIPVDSPEVHVCRRVYRSGEGEYLINGQPCRLKDIRDLFRGTGVGTDAYSLIEQGKVDRLLQASTKDRRAIFEEAAGISRFKAKKIEAQRRLGRVEQNLLRLSDIVDEVDNRLKSIRSQAGKAKRYREYSDRLQQLRTHVGMCDWRRFSEELETVDAKRKDAQEEAEVLLREAEQHESRCEQIETELAEGEQELVQLENSRSECSDLIARLESKVQFERQRVNDLDEEAILHRAQVVAMTGKAGDLQSRVHEVEDAWVASRESCREQRQKTETVQASFTELDHSVATARQQTEVLRTQHTQCLREAGGVDRDVSQLATRKETNDRSLEQQSERLLALETKLAQRQQELKSLQGAELELVAAIQEKAELIEETQNQIAESRRLIARRQEDLAVLRGRRESMLERILILEEQEATREGVSPGVQQVLSDAASQNRFNEIRGLVADNINVDVQFAALIDAALSSAAQCLVVASANEFAWITTEFELKGRVDLFPLDSLNGPRPRARSIDNDPRLIGRADQLVQCSETIRPLIEQLLGTTYLLDAELPQLMELRAEHVDLTLVSREGDVLSPSGAISLASRQAAPGLVSRRSELASLRDSLIRVNDRISASDHEVGQLRENVVQQEVVLRRLSDLYERLRDRLSDQRVQCRTLEQQVETADSEIAQVAGECTTLKVVTQQDAEHLAELGQRQEELSNELSDLEAELDLRNHEVDENDAQRRVLQADLHASAVELAKREQRFQTLDAQRLQLERDTQERSSAVEEAQLAMQRCFERRSISERGILVATSGCAEEYLRLEQFQSQIAAGQISRQQGREERSVAQKTLQKLRKQLKQFEEILHRCELEQSRIQHERDTLVERLRDDYGINLERRDLTTEDEEEIAERVSIEVEIHELRRKISNIGAVNMEALDELDDLEDRFNTLSRQYEDLVNAKDALERIISRINADSRRLFVETLEAIRTNFQSLYRKAFGGGTADIVLEEGVDVLEAGVEILATPPGKPSFDNSLLSGGEKALTAVALLLAIFQFRPSPFCVLDEVDAPFDEANIGRFVDVLREFLGWTKFVVVTHSKQTMTAANTIYGITMQESGISKRVSVRFEDVSEDGHILQDAVDRELPKDEVA
jgi:chromosome segregation protein